MTVLELQKALKAAGFDPGPLDGIVGPKTRAAIAAFQRARGLEVDGIAGPETRKALFGDAAAGGKADEGVPLDLPWLEEARRMRGVTEKPGPASADIIVDWALDLGLSGFADSTAWCGLFVAHCIRTGLPDEPIPADFLGARMWLKFGQKVEPKFGSVMVFWREDPDSWKGHVGFYWAEDANSYAILGGNQSNAVNVSTYPKAQFLGARWPVTSTATAPRRMGSPQGQLLSLG
jgi:uncharacterized protein (TIGR02594 family)